MKRLKKLAKSDTRLVQESPNSVLSNPYQTSNGRLVPPKGLLDFDFDLDVDLRVVNPSNNSSSSISEDPSIINTSRSSSLFSTISVSGNAIILGHYMPYLNSTAKHSNANPPSTGSTKPSAKPSTNQPHSSTTEILIQQTENYHQQPKITTSLIDNNNNTDTKNNINKTIENVNIAGINENRSNSIASSFSPIITYLDSSSLFSSQYSASTPETPSMSNGSYHGINATTDYSHDEDDEALDFGSISPGGKLSPSRGHNMAITDAPAITLGSASSANAETASYSSHPANGSLGVTSSGLLSIYEHSRNDSALSFTEDSTRAEQELINKSTHYSRSGSSDHVSPLKRRSATKKLVFSNDVEMHEVELDTTPMLETSNLSQPAHNAGAAPSWNSTSQSERRLSNSHLRTNFLENHYRQSYRPPSEVLVTKSQYENYRKSVADATTSHDNNKDNYNDAGDDYSVSEISDASDTESISDARRSSSRYQDDDDNDAKKNVRMRQKQDAHLSVYRQKMTKVTGQVTGQVALLKDSSAFFNNDQEDDSDDEYDDVPLGILKAHGFPSTGRLRAMHSQPNLLDPRVTTIGAYAPSNASVLYDRPGTPARLTGETASLRSFRQSDEIMPRPGSAMRAGLPGVPATPPLPSVFGAAAPVMNRGLIGEIAREEEAKARRKSQGNTIAALASSGASLFPSGSSIYGPPQQPSPSNEIQAQLQQVMQLQIQMMQQMAGGAAAVNGVAQQGMGVNGMSNGVPLASHGIPHFLPSSNLPPMKKHWSAFDIPTVKQNYASSIRSVGSGDRATQRYGTPSLNELAQQELRGSGSRPSSLQPSSALGPNMTPVGIPSSPSPLIQDSSDMDEDDNDEKEWEEMLRKRKGLKELWKQQQSIVV